MRYSVPSMDLKKVILIYLTLAFTIFYNFSDFLSLIWVYYKLYFQGFLIYKFGIGLENKTIWIDVPCKKVIVPKYRMAKVSLKFLSCKMYPYKSDPACKSDSAFKRVAVQKWPIPHCKTVKSKIHLFLAILDGCKN